MKKPKILSLAVTVLIILCLSFGCSSTGIKTDEAPTDRITSLQIEPYGFMSFVIRYSNFIYDFKGKMLKFPIFQGTFGDINYDDFKQYCWNNELMSRLYGGNGFIIKCRKGEIRKTFLEFLAFYKSNILRNVDMSTADIAHYNGRWSALINFEMDGIPCEMAFSVAGAKKDRPKSVYDIKPDENVVDASFQYRISPKW